MSVLTWFSSGSNSNPDATLNLSNLLLHFGHSSGFEKLNFCGGVAVNETDPFSLIPQLSSLHVLNGLLSPKFHIK